MDTRTGEIHELNAGETVDDLAKRLGGKPTDYVPISHRPDGKCRRCNGTGAVPAGFQSKRFKPCRCTMEQ